VGAPDIEQLLGRILHQLEAMTRPRVYETKVLNITMPPPGSKIEHTDVPDLAEIRRQMGADGWEIEHVTPTQACRSVMQHPTGFYITMYLRRPVPICYPERLGGTGLVQKSAPAATSMPTSANAPSADEELGAFRLDWVSMDTAAAKLGVPVNSVRKAVRLGLIPSKTLPKTGPGRAPKRIQMRDAEKWYQSTMAPPKQAAVELGSDDLDSEDRV